MSPTDIDAEARAQLDRAVSRVCPPWLREYRDDLVQMSAMKILRTQGETDMSASYLYRVAYSVVIDEIRRRRRRQEVGMSPSMPDRIANSGELSPETRAHGATLGLQLTDCIGLLSLDRRRAVTLYLQDHSIPEIAQILSWDRKKASNAVYRGLSDLRVHLGERGIAP